MSDAASLIAAGQAFHAAQFPATISINSQGYSASCSTLSRQRDLLTGAWLNKYKIAFWLPLSAFATAGQPVAKAGNYVAWTTYTFVVDEATIDPTGTTILLRCKSPDE